ncbi:hypothetical protein RN001_001964 [Aquatica leii]|uniref:Uncharacterized protein n=1 Tax=Aquatica leii TaxID=1421715 RepID=A0AAN7QN67_9COLE|nr:hypothetical protein RN001_001964 [Aquatica leii]
MDQNKTRLRDAYENIELFASNTWTNSSNVYQRANQELHARENIVQDILHSDNSYPKTVRSVIPESRLAQYSNYEYNEERELLYAPHSRNMTFYCPCSYKKELIKEPWMLPEIEQAFIWLSFKPDFDILELLHLDDFDDQVQTDCKPPCCLYNFYHINPNFCDSFEVSGKTRFTASTSLSDAEMSLYKPVNLKVDTFEDMILRINIKSDKVKHLWSRYSQPKIETGINKKCSIKKSPLGNSFFVDENRDIEQYQQDRFFKSDWLLDQYHLKRTDFGKLQYLADSIRTLKMLFFKHEKRGLSLSLSTTTIPYEEPDVDTKSPVPSTRRLYSAVLQGLGSDTNKSDIPNYSEIQEQSYPIINMSSSKPTLSIENSFNTPDTMFGNQKNLPIYTTASSDRITQTQTCESSKSYTQIFQESIPTSNYTQNKSTPFKILNTASNSGFCLDTSTNNVSNVLGICLNSPYFVNSYTSNSPFTTHTYNNFVSNNSASNTLNTQYPVNFHAYTNAGLHYTNNLYPPSNAFQSSQIPLNSRIPQLNRTYPSNQMHSMWFVSQNRTPPIYSVAHYTSQPYLYLTTPQLQTPQPSSPLPHPLPRQNQRWQCPVPYVRSPNPFHISVPPQYPALTTPQQWGIQNQNIYRVNSNQQIEPNQQMESHMQNRSKIKTKKLNVVTCNARYKVRSKSPEELCSTYPSINKKKASYDMASTEKQFFIKTAASTSSLEYRRLKYDSYKSNEFSHIGKRASAMAFKNDSEIFVSSDSDGSHTLLPIASSLSEDLERQALEQYQNSNENFYQELERQAEEQYDGDRSENLFCPPYKTIYIGGLIVLSILFY